MTEKKNGVNGQQSQTLTNHLQNINAISASSFPDNGERGQALLATYAMLSRLETPWETILRLCMGQVGLAVFQESLKIDMLNSCHSRL